MALPAKKRATYQDVLNAPKQLVAELVQGVLYTSPRPRSLHSVAASSLMGELYGPFGRGRGGPGGWVILTEPELHFGEDVLVPDLGGWRRERMPEVPDAPFFNLSPDWVCEVLSPSTEAFDRSEKLAVYAAHRVSYVWLIDPGVRTLEAFQLDGKNWRLLATYRDEAVVRSEPFETFELKLSELWAR
jgi:Uma2 family endonuclease